MLQVNELGHRDVDAGLPMQRDTIFRIASMTKPVTVAAAMTLVEEGRLALTDPVAQWLPELADLRVMADPRGPLDDDRAAAAADHVRRPDDPPQRLRVRVLGRPAARPRLRQADVPPGPGPLAGRAGEAAAGSSARRAADLQPRHRRARASRCRGSRASRLPTCWTSASSNRSACPTPVSRSARGTRRGRRRCTARRDEHAARRRRWVRRR